MLRRAIVVLTGFWWVLWIAGSADAAALPAATASQPATSPTFSARLTVTEVGKTVSDNLLAFKVQATAKEVSFSAKLVVNSPLLRPLVQASRAGTTPTAVVASIEKAGTVLETIKLPKPRFSFQQDVSRTDSAMTATFNAPTAGWVVHAGQAPVRAPVGVLRVTATSTSPPVAVPVAAVHLSATPAGSASHLGLRTSQPFDGDVSGPIVTALEDSRTLYRVDVALYKPGTTAGAGQYQAGGVTVAGFDETVNGSSIQDTVDYTGSFHLVASTPFHQPISEPAGVLQLAATPSTPALAIPLTSVAAEVIGGQPAITTGEPLDTSFSPSLLLAQRTGTVIPSASLYLFAQPGSSLSSTYALANVTVEQFGENAGPRALSDNATFRFQSLSSTLGPTDQIGPTTPAGLVALPPSDNSVTALISNSTLDFSKTSRGGRTIGATVNYPADTALSGYLLSAGTQDQPLPELDLSVFQPGTTTVAATYTLRNVTVQSFVETAGSGPLNDEVTLTPASTTVAVPAPWHPQTAHPAGMVTVTPANGSPSGTPITLGQVGPSAGTMSASSTELFDSTTTPALIASTGNANALSAASIQFYDYTPRRAAITWFLATPTITDLRETATGQALTDNTTWAFTGIRASYTPGPARVFPTVGHLTMVPFPSALPHPTVTMPVGQISDSISGTNMTMSIVKPFDTHFFNAFTASSDASQDKVDQNQPGTSTPFVLFTITRPDGTFTESGSSSGVSDALTIGGTQWTAKWAS